MKDTDFYYDNFIDGFSSGMMNYCERLADKFDNVAFRVECSCGSTATCFLIPNSVPQPTFLCESCGQNRKENANSSGTVCDCYSDLFTALPGTSLIDREMRNEALKYLRVAKGFRKYVTAKKAGRFMP